MEQEKKHSEQASEANNNAQHAHHSHKKKRPHRPKSYFIDPAAPTNADQKPKEPQKENTAKPPRKDVKDQKEGKQEKPNTPVSHPKETQDGSANRNKNRHRNRNRNKNRNPQNSEPASSPSQGSNPPKEQPQKTASPSESKNNSGNAKHHKNAARRSQDTILKDSVSHSVKTPAINDLPDGEYEEIRFPSIDEPSALYSDLTPMPKEKPLEEESPLIEVVGIRFKSSGKIYYFDPARKKAKKGEYAIVETARGLEYGEVALGNTMVKESDTVPPLRPIVRIATDADRKHHDDNKKKEEDAFRVCNEKIAAHGLDMKLIDAQYTFDNSKLLFYFTSAGRVDFRDLVKDLAGVFRTRIELRQIGIRDEAKLMGGMGPCGRSLCCTRFLSDFGQVSIKMAKEQNLSLNSAKISGICGRLMCCLRYEQQTYEYELQRTPPVGATVRTADGLGTVTEISPLVGTVKVRLSATPEVPPKPYRREELVMLKKKQGKQEK